MNELLNQILGLGELGFGAPDVEIGFERPLARWGWMLVVLAAATIAVASYIRLRAPRPARVVLAGTRMLLLVVIAVLATGPHLLRQPIVVQRDTVVIMLDRSASMLVQDAAETAADIATISRSPRLSRDAQLRTLLRSAGPTWDALADEKDLLWLGFDAGAYPLGTTPPLSGTIEPGPDGDTDAGMPVAMGDAAGRSTRIATSLEAGLRLAGGQPISAVVVFSDGRSADGVTRSLARTIAGDRIPIIGVPLGAAEPSPDVAVTRVESADVVFAGDLVPVRVTLQRSGPPLAEGPIGRVDLIDMRTGATIATENVDAGAFERDEPVLLLAQAQGDGEQRWSALFVPAEPDLIAANDRADVRLRVADRPLRVLYLDGYPRWEQRYLTQLLLREQSVVVTSVLVATDRRYQQEGNELLPMLPDSPEGWAPFDVVIMGDVRAEAMGRDQLTSLRTHITERGAGLLWIAGAAAVPQGWFSTPLGDLLPMRPTSSVRGGSAAAPPLWDVPVVIRPSDAAAELGLLTVGSPGQPSALPEDILSPSLGWTTLRWAQRLGDAGLKPAVEVLASASAEADGPSSPLVVSMRFGAGRVMYVGTDDVWRWRYGRGEVLFERFWLPLVRSLGRSSLARDAGGATLRLSPAIARAGEAVTVRLELSSPDLIAAAPGLARITVRPSGDGDAETDRSVAATSLELTRSDAGGGSIAQYEGAWTPPAVGQWIATTDEPLLAAAPPSATVTVRAGDDELLRPQADHAFLADLAERSGGRMLDPSDLETLPEIVPNRARRVPGPRETAPLWDKPVWLVLMLFLLGFEWVVRRFVRLA